MRRLRPQLLLALLTLLVLTPGRALAQRDEDCLACHGDPSLTMERKGGTISLQVDPRGLEASAHEGLACADCHAGFDAGKVPHRDTISPVACLTCHSDAGERHAFHSRTTVVGERGAPPEASCKTCHGTHGVSRVRTENPPERAKRLVDLCGRCHPLVIAHYLDSTHGRAAGAGVKGAPNCMTCHAAPISPLRGETGTAPLKMAQEMLCLSCHRDDPDVRARVGPDAGFIAAYERSVHGSALLAGNANAANCVDCHGSHEMKRGMDPSSRVSKSQIPETCARCHGAIAEAYGKSVHALAVRRGNLQAPVCTDCHGEHNILMHDDPRSPVSFANLSAKVCTPCHSSVALSEKFGLATDRSQSFEMSYHGLAIRGGSVQAANCASCHGAHDIRPSADPDSLVNKANLPKTCGKCHEGANQKFAVGAVHVVMTARGEPILYGIAVVYTGMIVIVVGGMFLHNLLDYLRKTLRRLRPAARARREEGADDALYLRMTVGERLQHASMALAFTVLVVTGFMLRYPDSWWVLAIRKISPHAFELRSLAHRIAAVVMVLASASHIASIVFTARGRQFIRDIFPRRQDAYDVIGQVAWNLGLTKRKPRFGRFSYVEKSEYWALVWGTMVMVTTGTILWFENAFIGVLTKLGWDISRTIHFYEAVLAALAILVWHIYFVVFNPDVYPMSPAWITGYIGEAQMEEEHSLELEEIRKRRTEEEMRERAASAAGLELGLGTSESEPGEREEDGAMSGRDARGIGAEGDGPDRSAAGSNCDVPDDTV